MKDLTIRYSVTQFCYWAAASGGTAFATTYLLGKGLPSGTVGALLAAAGLLSCVSQPFFASLADRSRRFLLTRMLVVLSVLCCLCLFLQLAPGLPLTFTAIVYTLGMWSSDVMIPLLNALSVACNSGGYPIRYTAARGIGSAATAISSLVIGHILAKLGTLWMLLFLLAFRLLCIFSLLGYPKLTKSSSPEKAENGGCTLWNFCARYRWYCASVVGIAFMGMFLAMMENYLIAIVQPFGGDSSHVGTALFLSSMITAPVIFCFGKIRKRFSDITLLKISALSFLVRAICLYFAGSIPVIYLLQLLHIPSYGFLHPTQVYYAEAKVRPADMVKGQAFITAAYALGCAIGNFAGGQLLKYGVHALLLSGIAMTLTGTGILFLTLKKSDPAKTP